MIFFEALYYFVNIKIALRFLQSSKHIKNH